MQTFLSEPNLVESVTVLDNIRLNKQLLEGWQILNAISITPAGGGQRVNGKVPFASNHPVTNQWRGFEGALEGYLWLCKYELDARGTKTEKLSAKLQQVMDDNRDTFNYGPGSGFPAWYKDEAQRERVLLTHRFNLFNKDREYYAKYEAEGRMLDSEVLSLVCCPDKVRKHLAGNKLAHAPYYYPTH